MVWFYSQIPIIVHKFLLFLSNFFSFVFFFAEYSQPKIQSQKYKTIRLIRPQRMNGVFLLYNNPFDILRKKTFLFTRTRRIFILVFMCLCLYASKDSYYLVDSKSKLCMYICFKEKQTFLIR